MNINRECCKIYKRLLKLSRKLFGHRTFSESLDVMNSLKKKLEICANKPIENFEYEDIRKYRQDYALYSTLKRFVDVYINLVAFEYKLENR